MRGIFWIFMLSIIAIFSLINVGCKKEASLPTISTTPINSITDTTILTGGNISSDGGNAIEVRGVCWNTTINPTTFVYKTTDGNGNGVYTSIIKGIKPGTIYHVRAYATNSVGTAYGQDISFTSNTIIPELNTIGITSITTSSAACGGSIINDGGSIITITGVCWNTTGTPTINDNKTIDINTAGGFLSSITGLEGYTTYYVRAYATNNVGTAYGNQVKFRTNSIIIVTDYDGNVYNTVTLGTQVWMAENLKTTHYRNGDKITYGSAINYTDQTADIEGYNWYGDLITNKNIYGANYNWYAITDSRNLCPIGWHVPSSADWKVLIAFLGGSNVAGGKMKEDGLTHWINPNIADNSSGFNALPGGSGFEVGHGVGSSIPNWYSGIGTWARFGSSSLDNTYDFIYYIIALGNDNSIALESNLAKKATISVRCIKD